jgi:SAM-dependent methyltransferase
VRTSSNPTSARSPSSVAQQEACPVCAHVGLPIGTSLGATVFACGSCDLWFLSSAIRPGAEHDNHWYAGMAAMSGAALQRLTNQMADPYRRQLDHLRRLTDGRDLLDLGSGVGMFLHEARRDWNAFGVETSSHGRAFARSRLGLQVAQHVDELPIEEFDVVRLSHVLEHIPDPRGFAAWAASLLRPHGILFVIVPNRESLVYWVVNRVERVLSPSPRMRTAIYPRMHVLGFSKRSLVNLFFEATGLRALSVKTVSMGDREYYPLLYDGLLRIRSVREVTPRSAIRYHLPVLLANLGNPVGLGDWIVAYFRKPGSSS